MRIILILIFCLLSSLALAKVKVVDGDSLEIDGRRVRLNGIDAPEYGQMCFDGQGLEYDCGSRATEEMKKLVSLGDVDCKTIKKDIYERDLSVCYVNGTNINKAMVLSGWAVSYDYKNKGYKKAEKKAKEGSLGVWQGKFMKPELYRRLNKD